MVNATDSARGEEPPRLVCLTHNGLLATLNTDDVDAMYSGLASFNRSLAKLVQGEVDGEISEEADLLKAYLKGSPEASELFRIWSFLMTNHTERLATVVPDVLARVILGSKLVGLFPVGSAMARLVIRDHMTAVYRGLSSGKHVTIQATLRLLVAVAGLKSSTAKELHDTFNFNLKALPKIITIRQKASAKARHSDDIRSLYVQFLLAFLENGDAVIKKVMLETKDLLSAIFKGLTEDSFETVDRVLSTFKRCVVDDSNLARTLKISFFNHYILEQITKLYKRNEPVEGGQSIADVAHAFLLHTCTNPGIGICFQDAGWYPAKAKSAGKTIKVYNTVLLKLLLSLKPIEDPRQSLLLLAGLKNCPELVRPYWAELGALSFEPRVSTSWFSNMALAAKIIQLPVPQHFGASEMGLPPPPVGLAADNILPPPLDRSVCNRALQHSNSMVKHTSAVVLALAFEKLNAVQKAVRSVINDLLRSQQLLEVTLGNVSSLIRKWTSFFSEIAEELRRRLPDLQIILALQNQQLKQAGIKDDSKDAASDAMVVDEPSVQTEEISSETLHCAALQLIRHYQRQFPETVLESRVNYGKFLLADLTGLSIELQLHLLDLIAEVPEFNWKERSANAVGSHLGTFAHLYIVTETPEIVEACGRVLQRIFADSFFFQFHVDEISVWLDILRTVDVADLNAVLAWLDEALCTGARTPYRIVDRTASLVSEAHDNMEESSKCAAVHILNTRRRVALNLHSLDDVPYFPFSPALLCIADGLHALIKREADHAPAARAAARCFSKLVVRIYHSTQAVGNYLVPLVERATCDTSGSNFRSVSDWNAGHYLAAATQYLKEGPIRDSGAMDFGTMVAVSSNDEGSRRRQLDELRIRHPTMGSLLATSATVNGPAATVLFTNLSYSDLLANVFCAPLPQLDKYSAALQSRIDGCTEPQISLELTRQILLHMSTATANCVVPRSLMGLQLLESLVASARHVSGATDTVSAGILTEANVYEVVRETVFGHPFLLNIFVSDAACDAPLRSAVVEFVHRAVSAEYAWLQSQPKTDGVAGTIALTWRAYTERIRDKLLSEIAAGAVSLETTHAFSLFRAHMSATSLNVILEPLLAGDQYTHQLLLLALTAKSGEETQVVTAEFFKRLVQLMTVDGGVEPERIVANILRDALLPEAVLQEERRKGECTSARFNVCEGSDSSAPACLTAFFDESILSYLVRRLKTAQGTTSAEILQLVVLDSPTIASKVINRIAKEKLVSTLSLDVAKILFSAFMRVCSIRTPPPMGQPLEGVQWIAEPKSVVVTLYEQILPSIKKSLIEGLTGADTERALDADALFRTATLFKTGYQAPNFMDELLSAIHTVGRPVDALSACQWLGSHLAVLQAFAQGSTYASERVLLLCLGLLQSVYASKKKVTASDLITADEKIIRRVLHAAIGLTSAEPGMSSEFLRGKAENVKAFLVATMKYRLADEAALRLLHKVVICMYQAGIVKDGGSGLPLLPEVLCERFVSHSQFLAIIQASPRSNVEETDAADRVDSAEVRLRRLAAKTELLKLLQTVMVLDPTRCCKTSYLSALAQSYTGTVHESDRAVLEIWKTYETVAGISVEAYARQWGQIDDGTDAAWAATLTPSDALAKVDQAWMAHTCQSFPSGDVCSSNVYSARHSPLYDPDFFLPLISSAIVLPEGREGPYASPRQLLETNSLALAIAALACDRDATRRAGYFILDLAYNQLIADAEGLRERNQVLLALDGLKNVITIRSDAVISKYATTESRDETPRISGIMAVFFAQAVMIAMKPEHEMYSLINRFFLQRPTVDMEDIPMFYELFYSASEQSRKERVWMLRLLACGLKTAADYRLYKRRRVVDILLTCYNSPIADTQTRKLIVEFLLRATTIPSVLSDMITQSGLVVFLTALCGTVDFGGADAGALGFVKLVRRVQAGFAATPMEWHGLWRSVWVDSIAGCAGAILQGVAFASRVATPGTENVAWGTSLLVEVVALVAELRDAYAAISSTASPISAAHIEVVISLWNTCWETIASTRLVTSNGNAEVENEVEELRENKGIDLDTLHAVPTSPPALVMALERTRKTLFGIVTALPADGTGSPATAETLTAFLLATVETRTMELESIFGFVTFLGGLTVPPSTALRDRVRRVAFGVSPAGFTLARRIRNGLEKVLGSWVAETGRAKRTRAE
ncbi:hypothetical protein HDU87_003562 [Geranomyces variabilis]|uniref:Nucleolar pre-ribosomal-associated protein 1 n=1 Tax=Geranomyces variabilis TaxID=109894 RepID=A0AAD5XR90_9FUNG|nr:hypothetical protein HDU87_003562 [Geranomyces variabilis]